LLFVFRLAPAGCAYPAVPHGESTSVFRRRAGWHRARLWDHTCTLVSATAFADPARVQLPDRYACDRHHTVYCAGGGDRLRTGPGAIFDPRRHRCHLEGGCAGASSRLSQLGVAQSLCGGRDGGIPDAVTRHVDCGTGLPEHRFPAPKTARFTSGRGARPAFDAALQQICKRRPRSDYSSAKSRSNSGAGLNRKVPSVRRFCCPAPAT